jgi:hypothetical protein
METTEETRVVDVEEARMKIREQIIHILGIYPILSPTMLQGGLGPYKKPAQWKPILEELIREGIVVREATDQIMTPSNRYNTYTLLRLANAGPKH